MRRIIFVLVIIILLLISGCGQIEYSTNNSNLGREPNDKEHKSTESQKNLTDIPEQKPKEKSITQGNYTATLSSVGYCPLEEEESEVFRKYINSQSDFCVRADIESNKKDLNFGGWQIDIYDHQNSIVYYYKDHWLTGQLTLTDHTAISRRFINTIFDGADKVYVILYGGLANAGYGHYGDPDSICTILNVTGPVWYSMKQKCDIEKLKSDDKVFVFELNKESVGEK